MMVIKVPFVNENSVKLLQTLTDRGNEILNTAKL